MARIITVRCCCILLRLTNIQCAGLLFVVFLFFLSIILYYFLFYHCRDNGFVQNKALAVVWYKKAALQGNIRAMFNLGVCYSNGIDGPITDWNIAAMYFKMAADHGCGRSAHAYGSILLKDNGPLEQNVPRAVSYLKMAADRGCAESAFKYGLALLNGLGLDTDIEAAALYLKLAAERGNPRAAKCYAALLTQCCRTWTRVTMNDNRNY